MINQSLRSTLVVSKPVALPPTGLRASRSTASFPIIVGHIDVRAGTTRPATHARGTVANTYAPDQCRSMQPFDKIASPVAPGTRSSWRYANGSNTGANARWQLPLRLSPTFSCLMLSRSPAETLR
jgi:hypothetical protein